MHAHTLARAYFSMRVPSLPLLQAGAMDFYAMSDAERSRWLDDGLHLTEYAYDQMGEAVFKELVSHLCELPPQSSTALNLAARLMRLRQGNGR
jgi:hypothetical protein